MGYVQYKILPPDLVFAFGDSHICVERYLEFGLKFQ